MKDIIANQGLVVSCQALSDEPLYGPEYMTAMARAAQIGGAVGIRTNGLNDILAISREVDLPIIGLNKKEVPGFDVYITPTVEEAVTVYESGADIVAIDGTGRLRPDDKTLAETIVGLHERNIPVMADISTFEEGIHAFDSGADYVSTTLSGYTPYSKKNNGPDLELVYRLVKHLSIPVAAEGRITSPEQAVQALKAGARFVVVGGAITRPQWIVSEYASQMKHYTNQSKIENR